MLYHTVSHLSAVKSVIVHPAERIYSCFQVNIEFNNRAVLILPEEIIFKQFLYCVCFPEVNCCLVLEAFVTSQTPFPLKINDLHVFPQTDLHLIGLVDKEVE